MLSDSSEQAHWVGHVTISKGRRSENRFQSRVHSIEYGFSTTRTEDREGFVNVKSPFQMLRWQSSLWRKMLALKLPPLPLRSPSTLVYVSTLPPRLSGNDMQTNSGSGMNCRLSIPGRLVGSGSPFTSNLFTVVCICYVISWNQLGPLWNTSTTKQVPAVTIPAFLPGSIRSWKRAELWLTWSSIAWKRCSSQIWWDFVSQSAMATRRV